MSCLSAKNCKNENHGCGSCIYSFLNLSDDSEDLQNLYSPFQSRPHEQEKIWAKEKKTKEQQTEKFAKFKEKQKLKKRADRTENIVQKTLNSGRVNRDGDLKTDRLTIDVKLQTTTLSPKINRDEWLKLQQDAKRALKDYGVLAIVNKVNETFYVIPEEMFKEIIYNNENQ